MASVDARPAGGDDAAGAVERSRVLALDVGGTKLAAGVVDADGRIHSFVVAPTRAEQGAEQALERLFDLGRQAVSESAADWSSIEAVGIGCGGPLDPVRGVLLAPLHLPGWNDLNITRLAEQAYDRPAVLENDATAAAAGEHRHGAGVGTRTMVYLTISTGVGGGVILDGKPYRGATGNGGELGHVTVDCDGRVCRGCGRRGCLEAYASGTSIAERAREAGMGDVTAQDVAAAARAGDPLATEVWEATVTALACGLTSIVNLFEPELVVVGGGVSRAGEQLVGPVRERVAAEAVEPARSTTRIVLSALGDTVGVVGAAAITFDRMASGLAITHG